MTASDNTLDPDLPQPAPMKLVFPDLGRKRVPHGYISIQEALDRLGLSEHPTQWGLLPQWKKLPFLRRRQEFVQPRLKLGDRAKLVYRKLNPELPEEEIKLCFDLYRDICGKLSVAFQNGEIAGCSLRHPGGQIEKIEAKGIWATQGTRIFYLGIVPLVDESQDTTYHRVIMEAKTFAAWLEEHVRKRNELPKNKLIDFIVKVLTSWSQGDKHKRKFVKDTLQKLIANLLARPKLEKLDISFDDDIWAALPDTATAAGERSQRDRQAFVDEKDEKIVRPIEAEIARLWLT